MRKSEDIWISSGMTFECCRSNVTLQMSVFWCRLAFCQDSNGFKLTPADWGSFPPGRLQAKLSKGEGSHGRVSWKLEVLFLGARAGKSGHPSAKTYKVSTWTAAPEAPKPSPNSQGFERLSGSPRVATSRFEGAGARSRGKGAKCY